MNDSDLESQMDDYMITDRSIEASDLSDSDKDSDCSS